MLHFKSLKYQEGFRTVLELIYFDESHIVYYLMETLSDESSCVCIFFFRCMDKLENATLTTYFLQSWFWKLFFLEVFFPLRK